MRKLFLFATVAAAGLFAGCSSTDDAISDAGNSGVENVDGDKTAIKIGIGNLVNMETRGTGTVGGVGDGTNVWAGQNINVFMFNKITAQNQTLTLVADPTDASGYFYNNRVMITPGSAENKITGMSAALASGEAMNADGSIKYYPYVGNFDFFGYHVDDAIQGDVVNDATTTYTEAQADAYNAAHNYTSADPGYVTTETINPATASKWWVRFAIDGSQDLMTTKAALTAAQDMGTTRPEDYYSAYSARREVHPTLTFKHLLTRLQFKVKAGNEGTAGYVLPILNYSPKATVTEDEYNGTTNAHTDGFTPATYWDANNSYAANNVTITTDAFAALNDADKALFTPNYGTDLTQDVTRAVKVEEIQILSKTTGKLMAAWVNDAAMDEHAKIEWDEVTATNPKTWLSLKERPSKMYNLNDDQTIGRADIEAYKDMTDEQYAALNETTTPKQSEVDAAIAAAGNHITPAVYATLSAAGILKYTEVTTTGNDDLVTLTPTAITGGTYDATATPKWQVAENAYTSIGEALIVAPNEWTGSAYTPENLQMRVKVSQLVPDNWKTPWHYETQYQTFPLEVPYPQGTGAGAGAFQCNTSYNIILTVYGYDRIEVIAEVNPWNAGGERVIGDDEGNVDDWSEYTEDTNPTPSNP